MPCPPLLRLPALLICLPVAALAQVTIVSFTFEGTTSAVTGASLAGITWNSGGAEGYASVFSSQGQALSVSGFQSGEYYQVTLNAAGYTNLTLNSFRTNAAGGSAPKDWKISYSLTGIPGAFTDASAYTLGTSVAAGSSTIAGLMLPSGANNNSSIVLRFTATSAARIDGAGSAANGTVRLDNLSFSGIAIPEPSTYAAGLGLAALMLVAWRKRTKQKGPPVGGPGNTSGWLTG